MKSSEDGGRDPLRAVSQTGLFILFYLIAINLVAGPLLWAGGALVEFTLTHFIGAVTATFICWKIYGETPLPNGGLTPGRPAFRDFAIGLAAGAVAVSIVLAPAILLHAASLNNTPEASNVTAGTAAFVTILLFCGSAGEEMLFHGFAFQSLMRELGPFASILPVGIVFGLLHMANPNATWVSTLNTMGFGILFGYAVYRTSSLWLPIGLHFGWNIALPFFGVNISGITMRVTGYEMIWKAGPLWSGGAYGPEGSILTGGVLVMLLLFIWVYPFPRQATALSHPVESEPAP